MATRNSDAKIKQNNECRDLFNTQLLSKVFKLCIKNTVAISENLVASTLVLTADWAQNGPNFLFLQLQGCRNWVAIVFVAANLIIDIRNASEKPILEFSFSVLNIPVVKRLAAFDGFTQCDTSKD